MEVRPSDRTTRRAGPLCVAVEAGVVVDRDEINATITEEAAERTEKVDVHES